MPECSEQQTRLGRFWKKYLRLTRAGVGTLRALEIIGEESSDSDWRVVVASLHDALAEGNPISETMERFPRVFSRASREMIRTAEKEGHWDLVLEELSEGYLEGTFE